jgi:type II secretory pathway pseudopilin PulG
MLLYCLKPTYSLRNQLLLSFGTAAIVVAILSVIATLICYHLSKQIRENKSNPLFQQQAMNRLSHNSRYIAGSLELFTINKMSFIHLIHELMIDRIVGYPEPGWENDTYVPFVDYDTGQNKYPLQAQPLPLDWDIELNINEDNKDEHLQERSDLVDLFSVFSTSSASYFMQGACNPKETNPESLSYYTNCTAANNDVTTGGILYPTQTNYGLYQNSADLAVLLKPLYESDPEIL